MAHITADRVRESSTTTGTGAFTLAGAVQGFRAFSAVLAVNDTCYYTIADLPGTNWEVGIGTYSAASTLTRTTVLSSSNAGAAVTFGAGTKDVFITAAAGRFLQADSAGSYGTFSAGTITATLSGNSATSSRTLSSDTRAVTTTPETLATPGVIFDFKQNTSESLSDGGTYFGELTFRPYGSSTDWSGGGSHQLGFTNNANVWHRYGTGTTWGSWVKLYDTVDAATTNTASKLVLRDASGNFSAGTITATLSGNASTVTNGVYTTGDQTIGGNKTFSSPIIASAGLYGAGAGAPDVLIWGVSTTNPTWGIFYNEGTPDLIEFKAAGVVTSSISLDDGAHNVAKVNASSTGLASSFGGTLATPNATVATQTSYIQLLAGSGAATNSTGLIFHNPTISTSALEYVNTDANTGYFNFKSDDTTWNLRVAGNTVWHAGNDGSTSGLDADLLDGYNSAQASTVSTVAVRDGSGDINVRLIRQEYTDQATISGGMVFRVNNSTDNYLRVCNDVAAIKTYLGAANASHNHSGIYVERDEVKSFGTIAVQAVAGSSVTCTTAEFITWLETQGFFDYVHSYAKCTWDYAGNNDISDTGFGANFELAGCVIETWTDNSDDIVRGNITVRITAPTTGGTAGSKILVYNDQGAGYSPGWRQIWNSTTLTNLNQLTNGPGYTTNVGTVTSVGGTGTVSGLTLTGTVTTSGNLTLGGTLSADAAAISSGTIATARLGTGTADSTTYLRGDQTWATIVSGASLSNDTTTNATYYPLWATATTGTPTTIYTSSTKYYFNPSTGTLSSTTFNSLSDENYKQNIEQIVDPISIIKQLTGVTFDWKDNAGSSYGFIAQQVEKILPHAVATDEGKKTLNYSSVIPFLVESIKEQQKIIDRQEERIKRLEEIVQKLAN